MSAIFFQRSLETVLKKAANEFPAVVLTGPRQSGKTTLLKHLFGHSHGYTSLDLPDVRAAALSDPRGFFELHRMPFILDEIQHAPSLLPYIKELIDEDRSQKGRFLLSGSQNLLLMEKVGETLAGRVSVLRLYPLTRREIDQKIDLPLPWEIALSDCLDRSVTMSLTELWTAVLKGSFPEILKEPRRDTRLWHSSYLQTYLERDLRLVRNLGDLTRFQVFLRMLAARTGQLLNLTSLARDIGIAVNTVKAWLSILEAGHQIIVLRPYYGNIGKRLVKTAKIYFIDTGTLCNLLNLGDPEQAMNFPMSGNIFENAVIVEIYKILAHRGELPRLYFWRTATGQEVDLVLETDNGLIPMEIKSGATTRPDMLAGIIAMKKEEADRIDRSFVIYGGRQLIPLGENTFALPFVLL